MLQQLRTMPMDGLKLQGWTTAEDKKGLTLRQWTMAEDIAGVNIARVYNPPNWLQEI